MQEALKQILIVDDDAGYRQSIRFALQSLGYEFFEATSISDAKRNLTDLAGPLVIVLDLQLGGESGALLLDEARVRSAPTRVIVLTGHEEMLEAEAAHDYKVFAYLNKTEEFPVRAMKFALARAFAEIGESGDDPLAHLPEPIAYICHELMNFALEPMHEFQRHLDLVEALIKLCSSIVLSEYLSSEKRLADLDERIIGKIMSPTLGHWFFLMNDICKQGRSLSELHSPGVISDFIGKKNKRFLIDMIAVRNEHHGHAAVHSRYEYGSLVERFGPQVLDLIESAKFFQDFSLLCIDSVRQVRGEYIFKIFDCNGVSPQLLPSKKRFDRMLPAEEMLWIHKGSDWLQSLHPLLVLADCPECKKKEVFFFRRAANGKMDYVSSNTGHHYSSKAFFADFKSLLFDRAASVPDGSNE